MMTPSKNLIKLFFLGLLVFTFTACQTGISEAIEEGPTAQMTETNEDPCAGEEPEQGFELSFDRHTPPPPALGNPQTSGRLELIPNHQFSVASECLCYVDSYTLTFNTSFNPLYASYTNDAGAVIQPVSVVQIHNGNTITGYDVTFDLTDLDGGVFYGFSHGMSEHAELLQAGGLCMIDNIGAPDPDEKSIGPWEVTVRDKNGNPSTRYGIPTTVTSGEHRLLR